MSDSIVKTEIQTVDAHGKAGFVEIIVIDESGTAAKGTITAMQKSKSGALEIRLISQAPPG